MADGEVVFEATISDKKLHQELNKVKSNIESLQREFNRLGDQKTPMEDRLRNIGAELDAAKQELADMRTAPKGTYKKIDVSEQAERVRMLQSEFNKTANSIDKLNEKLNKTGDKISDAKTQAVELTQQIEGRAKGAGLRNATEAAADSMKVFGQRLKSVVRSALVFTVITQALTKVRDWVKNVVMVNSDARESIAQLKGALLTLAQPLVSVIVPAFTLLVKVITAVVSQITRLVALISGKSVKATANSAKALNKETSALKGTGSAAKKAASQLAAFDEINQISTDTANDTGGGASADAITPDFSYMDDISDRLKKIADAVMLIAAGLALWKISSSLPGVLGTILQKLGGILIAVGGLILLWDGLSDAWNNGVNWGNLLEMLAGTAAIAGGLAIAFGKVGAGIGLVVAGAAMIITAFKDICDNGANLQNTLLLIAGIMATGLGFFFLTGSVIPLAIAGIASILVAMMKLTGNLEEFAKNLKENILGGIIQFIKGVFTGNLKMALDGVKKVAKGIVNGVLIIVESFINNIIRGLNWLITKINSISLKVPGWVPGVGGKGWSPHIGQMSSITLPRLATGAVIPPNKEFLAVLGDQKSGTNIETPLATMVEAFKQAMAESGGGTTTVVVQLDGKEIARSTVKNINNMTRAAGKPVLLY
uniref:Minor tail protein n=1 Tax=Siphoviridae sp. ct6h44 TaxID=2827784 RepID=A0A8S5SZB3_9CAUD|nr:MAG TPA: minor tail protein [Siphoviridae sp. ct6h44]